MAENESGGPVVDQSDQMGDMSGLSDTDGAVVDAGSAADAGESEGVEDRSDAGGEEAASDEPTSETSSSDAVISELRRQLDSLISEKERQANAAAATPPIPQKSAYEEDHSFLGDGDDLEAIFNDRASFNKLLNSVRLKATQQAIEAAVERVSRTIPSIVRENASQALIIQQKGQEFYAKNKDLVQYRNVVMQVGNELVSKNPTWDIDKLYSEVAVESRKRLGLVKAATVVAPKLPGNVRRFPKTPGGKGTQGSQKLEGLAAEIAAMNAATNE
jgi:hypothetical protein